MPAEGWRKPWIRPYGGAYGAPLQPPYRPGQTGRAITTGKIPLPTEEAHNISLRAASYARAAAPKGPHGSANFIRETYRKGEVGVNIPGRVIHLLYLDRGIKPFVMWSLEGKTIPMRMPDGSIMFRKAVGVGQQVATRDETGRLTGSRIKWKHPGVKPMNFIEPAIERAINEWVMRQDVSDMLRILSSIPQIGHFFQGFRRTVG